MATIKTTTVAFQNYHFPVSFIGKKAAKKAAIRRASGRLLLLQEKMNILAWVAVWQPMFKASKEVELKLAAEKESRTRMGQHWNSLTEENRIRSLAKTDKSLAAIVDEKITKIECTDKTVRVYTKECKKQYHVIKKSFLIEGMPGMKNVIAQGLMSQMHQVVGNKNIEVGTDYLDNEIFKLYKTEEGTMSAALYNNAIVEKPRTPKPKRIGDTSHVRKNVLENVFVAGAHDVEITCNTCNSYFEYEIDKLNKRKNRIMVMFEAIGLVEDRMSDTGHIYKYILPIFGDNAKAFQVFNQRAYDALNIEYPILKSTGYREIHASIFKQFLATDRQRRMAIANTLRKEYGKIKNKLKEHWNEHEFTHVADRTSEQLTCPICGSTDVTPNSGGRKFFTGIVPDIDGKDTIGVRYGEFTNEDGKQEDKMYGFKGEGFKWFEAAKSSSTAKNSYKHLRMSQLSSNDTQHEYMIDVLCDYNAEKFLKSCNKHEAEDKFWDFVSNHSCKDKRQLLKLVFKKFPELPLIAEIVADYFEVRIEVSSEK